MGLISFNDPKAGSKYTTPPFWAGKNAAVKWFVDGTPAVINVVSWSLKQTATEGADHVNGEPRARPWRVVDGYDLSMNCRMRDAGLIELLLAASKVDDDDEGNDLGSIPAQHMLALILKPLDGGRYGFATSGIATVGAWGLNVGGQADRNTVALPFHFQNLNFVPA